MTPKILFKVVTKEFFNRIDTQRSVAITKSIQRKMLTSPTQWVTAYGSILTRRKPNPLMGDSSWNA